MNRALWVLVAAGWLYAFACCLRDPPEWHLYRSTPTNTPTALTEHPAPQPSPTMPPGDCVLTLRECLNVIINDRRECDDAQDRDEAWIVDLDRAVRDSSQMCVEPFPY